MAGIQSCFRSARFLRTSHSIFKNVLVKQSHRTNHIFTSGLFPARNKIYLRKLKIISNAHLQYAYRLSSTNSSELDKVLQSSEPKPSIEESQNLQQLDEKIGEPVIASTDIIEKATDLDAKYEITESMLPPVPTESSTELLNADVLNAALSEPTLSSLGLCSWWPSGRVQMFLEILHINLNLPWWESIAIVALSLRLITLPLNVIIKRRSVHMQNHMPQIQVYQKRIKEANITGDYFEAAKAFQENMDYLKANNIKLSAQFYPMFLQSFIFISMYWALKSMANLPVESLKTGGLWWFTDLAAADPYYILPALVSGTVFLVLKSGMDTPVLSEKGTLTMRLISFGLPVVIFPFLIFSPSVIQIYWTLSNLFILLFTLLLKVPAIKKALKIPDRIRHNLVDPSGSKKKTKFMEELKTYINNYKMHKAVMEREQLSAMNFQKAGNAPTLRTFKRDPTKTRIQTTK